MDKELGRPHPFNRIEVEHIRNGILSFLRKPHKHISWFVTSFEKINPGTTVWCFLEIIVKVIKSQKNVHVLSQIIDCIQFCDFKLKGYDEISESIFRWFILSVIQKVTCVLLYKNQQQRLLNKIKAI